MRALPIVLAVGLVLGALTGCGSSRPNGVNFHSASHHYTVNQVEEAFAAQGIRLREVAHRLDPGVVPLRLDHLAEALVIVKASGIQYIDTQHHRYQKNGNVFVFFNASNGENVKTALARLH
jgi:hypothetical protein